MRLTTQAGTFSQVSPSANAASDAARRRIPNALTTLRLAIAIVFFAVLAVWTYPTRELVIKPTHPVWPYLICAALFGLAALTDAIDGPLARRWNCVTRFGRVMDPFADKVLVVGAFIMLAGPNFAFDAHPGDARPSMQVSGVYPWMVVLILARELLVTSIRAVLEHDGLDFSASASGKAKMILQASVIPFVLVVLAIAPVTPGTFGRYAIDAAVWATLVATAASGIPYVMRAWAALRSA